MITRYGIVILIISSKSDEASTSMGNFIVENYGFKPSDDHSEEYSMGNFLLKFIQEKHLFYDQMEKDAQKSGAVESIIILSRHSSAADIKSLTVHPTGNFNDARLGGLPGQLSMSDPVGMSEALRKIRNNYSGNVFSVTFEATHHGPLIKLPHYYVEIGTTKEQWEDPEALGAVCESILDRKRNSFKNYVGAGGGHYMPKVTSYALENEVNIGHMIPKYQHDALNYGIIKQSVDMTPNCSGFILDRKGVKSGVREIITNVSEELGLEIIEI